MEGRWVLRERTNCCQECKKMVPRAWCFFEFDTYKIVYCESCAETLLMEDAA